MNSFGHFAYTERMKQSLLLLVSTVLALSACQKPAEPVDETPESAPATPEPERAEATPAPRATPSPATPAPAARRLAPAGVYFVLQRLSIPSDDGIVGIIPGTRVQMLRDAGETLQVSDGTHEFAVSRAQLTDDLDIAARLAQHDATQQAGVAARQRAQAQATALQQQKNALAAPAPGPTRSVRELQGRIDALTREEITLQNQLNASIAAEARRLDGRLKGRIQTGSAGSTQEQTALGARIQQLNTEQGILRRELRAAQR